VTFQGIDGWIDVPRAGGIQRGFAQRVAADRPSSLRKYSIVGPTGITSCSSSFGSASGSTTFIEDCNGTLQRAIVSRCVDLNREDLQ
jgi:hypothetical protein